MPLVWSLPEALVTAELATTFPSNAGFVETWIQVIHQSLMDRVGFRKTTSGFNMF